MPPKPGFDLNDTSNRIIVAIVIALIFVLGWWLIARNVAQKPAGEMEKDMAATTATGTTDSESPLGILGPIADTPTIRGSTEAIVVEDQSAGTRIVVKEATLVQVGWIAVRDRDGRTLGAGRFEVGSHANVEVPLLRATRAGERYQVLIYVDDGDRIFDLHEDILVTRPDGSVAGTTFSVR